MRARRRRTYVVQGAHELNVPAVHSAFVALLTALRGDTDRVVVHRRPQGDVELGRQAGN